jgi:hypothetical protein
MRSLVTLALVCSWLLLAACGRPRGESPVETVRKFIDAVGRGSDEEASLREAYALMDASARAELARRAERAGSLSGRGFEPWQMLVRGRFRLSFAPAAHAGMRERIEGDRAVVTVVSDKGGQRAEVPLVREQGHWRIQLLLPPQQGPREGAGQNGG